MEALFPALKQKLKMKMSKSYFGNRDQDKNDDRLHWKLLYKAPYY